MTATMVWIVAAVLAALLVGLVLGMRLARRRRVTVPVDDPRTGDVDWASLRYVERIWELPPPGSPTPSDTPAAG
jgi:hypothetical protein